MGDSRPSDLSYRNHSSPSQCGRAEPNNLGPVDGTLASTRPFMRAIFCVLRHGAATQFVKR